MVHSRKHRDTVSRESENECCQLTLDDWADTLRATPHPVETQARISANSKTSIEAPPSDHEPSPHAERAHAAKSHRPSATELLETPDALLTRTHLRELGLERRAIDAVFRALAVVALPGYSRPMVRAGDYLMLIQEFTYRGDRVRPIAKAS